MSQLLNILTNIFIAKDDILKLYEKHDTLIVIGDTGSGKTTRKLKAFALLILFSCFRNPTVYL